MKDELEEAKQLKEEAKTYIALARKTNDQTLFKEALDILREVRALLKKELDNLENADSTNTLLNVRISQVAAELADCFGIAGGAFRKWALLQDAIQMYDQGSIYEENPAYLVQSSYNMVNGIVLRVTDDPPSLESLKKTVETTIQIVIKQIKTSRERDWWAWADLGLLYILNLQEDLAIESYRKIKDLGAKEEYIRSISDVIIQLQKRIENIYPAIVKIIDRCIFTLNS